MRRKSFQIYCHSKGYYVVFTIVSGPGATAAPCDPQQFETLDALVQNLPSLVESRLAASHHKSDITGDTEKSCQFLKTIKARTWNVFNRECDLVSVCKDEEGFSIVVGHWDGRGFYAGLEDETELPSTARYEEVAARLLAVLKSLSN